MTQNEIDRLGIEKAKVFFRLVKFKASKSVLLPDFRLFTVHCSMDFILLLERFAN